MKLIEDLEKYIPENNWIGANGSLRVYQGLVREGVKLSSTGLKRMQECFQTLEEIKFRETVIITYSDKQHPKHWTPEQDALLISMHKEGYSWETIAKTFDRPTGGCKQRIVKLGAGLSKRRCRKKRS